MREISELLDTATAVLGELAARSPLLLDDAELLNTVDKAEQLGRLCDALRVFLAAEVQQRSPDAEGLAQRLGFTRATHLIERATRVSAAEAGRRVRLGAWVAPRHSRGSAVLPPLYPRVAAAMAAGTVTADAASAITRTLAQAHCAPDDIATAELQLVDIAAIEPADIVAVHARAWREALDPDGAEPRLEELRQQRRFHIGRETDGLTPFGGMADPVSAALLRAAFSDRTGPAVQPRFLDRTLEGADDETADPRTREQRNFDVFVGLITAGVRADVSPRPVAAVMATIELSALQSGQGVGWLDDVAEPIAASAIAELACDAGFQRIILGNHGEVLALGRRERFFTAAQRKALAVRDGGCVFSGCTAPPSWCHAHHVVAWQHGGATDVDNGALLCAVHHRLLHSGEFTMRTVNGRPEMLAPPWLGVRQAWKTVGKARVGLRAKVA